MNIDFSLVLVVLVLVAGLIWLFDALFLAKGREEVARQRNTPEEAPKEPVAVEYAKSFFPVLVIVLVLRSFLVEPFQIPSGSMIPTLEVGDFILVNKYAYGLRLPVIGTKIVDIDEPERGEVMVFIPPHDDIYFIKRVIGLPGDRIHYENKVLTVNGETVETEVLEQILIDTGNNNLADGLLLEETLGESSHQVQVIANDGRTGGRNTWVVPPGHYFMMGDNRDNSSDSRVWGPVPEENIVGKAFAIWMHKEPGLHLPTFSRNQVIR